MFDVWCPVHAARVLIWPSGVERVENRAGGIEVSYHCTCGHAGVWRTGLEAARGADLGPDPEVEVLALRGTRG